MATFKTFALAGIFTLSTSFTSTAYADTVAYNCLHKTHDYYTSSEWEKVVVDLKKWTSTHEKHHPYYYTMTKKLKTAEYNWKLSKDPGYHKKKSHKHHYKCKGDVSPS